MLIPTRRILFRCWMQAGLRGQYPRSQRVGISAISLRYKVARFLQNLFQLNDCEKQEVVTNCDHLYNLRFSRTLPYAFTEQGLYMLATVLRSPIATETTFAIIETFTKLRVLARAIQGVNDGVPNGVMPTEDEESRIQKMMNDVFKDPLPLKMRKMTFGVNLGFMKFSVETTREQ